MTREQIISKLQTVDPNGIWSDEDCIAEGYPILTIETATEALWEILNRD